MSEKRIRRSYCDIYELGVTERRNGAIQAGTDVDNDFLAVAMNHVLTRGRERNMGLGFEGSVS